MIWKCSHTVQTCFHLAVRRLVDDGFNPSYGARPLRRAVMRLIEDCLSERILTREIKEGDVVIMDVGEC